MLKNSKNNTQFSKLNQHFKKICDTFSFLMYVMKNVIVESDTQKGNKNIRISKKL